MGQQLTRVLDKDDDDITLADPPKAKIPLSWFTCLSVAVLCVFLMSLIILILNGTLLSEVKKIQSNPTPTTPSAPPPISPNHPTPTPPLPPLPTPESTPTPEPSPLIPQHPPTPTPTPTPTPLQLNQPAFKWLIATRPHENSLTFFSPLFNIIKNFNLPNPTMIKQHPILLNYTYVTCWSLSQGYVTVINGLSVASSAPLGSVMPWDVVIHPNGDLLFVTTGQGIVSPSTNRLIVFNISQDGSLSYYTSLSFGVFLQGMSFVNGGMDLYVTDPGSTTLFVVDPLSLKIKFNITVVTGMAFVKAINESIALVSGGWPSNLLTVDTTKHELIGQSISLPSGTLSNVLQILVDEPANEIHIPNGIDTVFIYSMSTLTPKSNYSTTYIPSGIWSDNNGAHYITHPYQGQIMVHYSNGTWFTIPLVPFSASGLAPLFLEIII